MEPTSSSPRNPLPRQLAIWELCVLIAGLAVGLWLLMPNWSEREDVSHWLLILTGILGGLSIVGPPMLLWERRRRRSKWGPGEVLWFSEGMAAWLLWPPILLPKLKGEKLDSLSLCVFVYGTPLMAIYVGSALLCGGWIRRRGSRRRRKYSWRERFGLLLALAWALTGGWILWIVYRGRV
jgi:uncharacterized membrane protein